MTRNQAIKKAYVVFVGVITANDVVWIETFKNQAKLLAKMGKETEFFWGSPGKLYITNGSAYSEDDI